MDSESRIFDAGTPLSCTRRMVPQPIAPVTPGQLLLRLLAALLPLPVRPALALIKRRRA